MATRRHKRDLSDEEIVRRAQALRELCFKTIMEEGLNRTEFFVLRDPAPRYYDVNEPPTPGVQRIKLHWPTEEEMHEELKSYGD